MRVLAITLLAIIGTVSAAGSCEGGTGPTASIGSCVLDQLHTVVCTHVECICTQQAHITACYKQYCGGAVPTDVADIHSTACRNFGGGPDVGPTPAGGASPTDSASASAAASLSATNPTPTATGSGMASGSATGASVTAVASVTGTAQPASTSKAAANLGFVIPAGGVFAAALGLAAYL